MTNKIDPCDTMRLNLIAAAVGLQQCTKTAANIIPIPGGDRVIAIGTPAAVRGLLAADIDVAPAVDLDKLEALLDATTPGEWKNDRGYLEGPPRSYSECYFENEADAEFIAASKLGMRALIAHARASQPESATGTTGASIDTPEFWSLMHSWRSCDPFKPSTSQAQAVVAHIDAIIGDLRAKLAATTKNLQTAVQEAWTANAELSKLRAAPASEQPDRGAVQPNSSSNSSSNCPAVSPASQPVAPTSPHDVCRASERNLRDTILKLQAELDARPAAVAPSDAKDAANAGWLSFRERFADAYLSLSCAHFNSPFWNQSMEQLLVAVDAEINKRVAEKYPATSAADAKDVAHAEMTPAMMKAVQLNSELGAYACANLSGAYDLFREFWQVAMAAAPSSEKGGDAVSTATIAKEKCKRCNGTGLVHNSSPVRGTCPLCSGSGAAPSSAAGTEGGDHD